MTGPFELRAPELGDEAWLLALNNAHAAETSELTATRLSALIAMSFRSRVVPPADAVCIAMDQSAAYDSPNFLWFRNRFEPFVYVDRVIVAAHARGHGFARALYADLTGAAKAVGHNVITCEVNVDPPNPGSAAFHRELGFVEAGRAELANSRKTVSYLTLAI